MTDDINADDVTDAAESMQGKVEDIVDGVKDAADSAQDSVEDVVDSAKDAMSGTMDHAADVVLDHTAIAATDDDKLWSLLAFVFTPLVSIIIMFMDDKKDRPFIKANSMQALVLGVLIIVLSFIPAIGCIVPIVWIYSVYQGIQAYNGKIADIPGITNFAKNQGWL